MFLCEVHGQPPPVVTWRKDGIALTKSTSVFITETTNYSVISSNMTLTNATLEDIGTYECNAENDLGESSENFSIFVYGTCYMSTWLGKREYHRCYY